MSKFPHISLVKEFSKLSAGGTPSTSINDYWDNGTIPWLSSGEIHKRRVRYADKYITKLGLRNSAAKLFPKKTVLVALAGQGKTRGTVAITEFESTTNQSIAGIISNNKKCHPEYLFYNLQSRYEELRSLSGGSGRAGLNLQILGNLKVQLPSISEQQKIVSILTSVDNVIDKARAQINKLQDLKKSTMNELLTKGIDHTEFKDSAVGRIPKRWNVRNTIYLLTFKNGLNTNKESFGKGVSFLTYKNIYSGLDLTEDIFSERVDVSEKEIKSFSVEYGDIFFTRTSETPDEIGLANTYLGKNINAVFNGFCIRGRPKIEGLAPEFSKFLFRAEYIRTQIKTLCKYTTRAGISAESLGKCLVCIPPITEQQKIASILSSIDKTIETKQQKLKQTQALKKSLMQDLLTGKVRVNV